MPIQWSDHVYETLAAAGVRRGGARDRVIDVLDGHACARSAAEIEDQLRDEGHPTGRASIYRTLDLLVDCGLVERVTTGAGSAAFEPLRAGGHHHHLVCDECGKLVAFNDTRLEREIDKLSERLGVRIESHEVLLRGACPRCN